MNLLILQPDQHDGCSWYRVSQFAKESKKHGVDFKYLSSTISNDDMASLIENADVFLMRLNDKSIQVLQDLRKFQPNKPIILDIDDAYDDIDPLSNMYLTLGTKEVQLSDGRWLHQDGKNFSVKENQKRLDEYKQVMRGVDGIIVTTFELKAYAQEFNDNVVVIPNCINTDLFPAVSIQKKPLRLVWAGGSSHYADLVELNTVLKDLMRKYPDLEYYHVGQMFRGIIKDLPENRVFTSPWLMPDGHGFRLATIGADIGVCPLQEIEFNRYKSSVKYYEYSALRIATVAKNMPPYSDDIVAGKNGLLYGSTDELRTHIEYLINNPLERITLAQNAYEYVTKYRNLKEITKDWVEYLTGMSEAMK